MISPTRLAATAAALGLVSAAHAQGPLVPPPATPPTAAPEIQYDTYFQPFDDNPVYRLQNVAPIPKPTPLFDDFDPLNGLDRHVETSWVALPSQAVFAFPVMTVRVGQTFDAPFSQLTGPDIRGLGLKVQYDPKFVQAIGASVAHWNTAFTDFFIPPDPDGLQHQINIAEVSGDPWPNRGRLLNVKMKAVAPGDSVLQTVHFDFTDGQFNPAQSLVRDGLIHVIP